MQKCWYKIHLTSDSNEERLVTLVRLSVNTSIPLISDECTVLAGSCVSELPS